MNLFLQLFLQSIAIIFGIVIIFQLAGKIFFKDSDNDSDDME